MGEFPIDQLIGKLAEAKAAGLLNATQLDSLRNILGPTDPTTNPIPPRSTESVSEALSFGAKAIIPEELVNCLLKRLVEALGEVIDTAQQTWCELPPPVPGLTVQKPKSFRSQFEEALTSQPEGFGKELEKLLAPVALVKALLTATLDAAEKFSNNHYETFPAHEICRYVIEVDGRASEKALYERFVKASKKWDNLACADSFRKAIIETVLKNPEADDWIKELRNGYENQKWPWTYE